MKSLLSLLLTLIFAWGCAVHASEQTDESGSKQESETVKKDSQNGADSSSGKKKNAEDEEDPDCE